MVSVRERVRFVETDMMGVVHHSNYFRWFEMGRVELLREAGIVLLDLMETGVLFPIKEAACQYIQPIRFDDVILIQAELHTVSKVKMAFRYRILREKDQTLMATGETVNVFTDSQGKIARLDEAIYDRISKLQSAVME